MKKVLLGLILTIGMSFTANAWEAGQKFVCAPYKLYNFKTEESYEFTIDEIKKMMLNVTFIDGHTIKDGSGEVYKYLKTNRMNFQIFIDPKDKTILSITSGRNKKTGYVTSGIIVDENPDIVIYSICKDSKKNK